MIPLQELKCIIIPSLMLYGTSLHEKQLLIQGRKCKKQFFLRKCTQIGHYIESPMGTNQKIRLGSQKLS